MASNDSVMLAKAIAITSKAFEHRFDKGGKPYILHCLYVMGKMPVNDPELQQIAVMHDLVEDTGWTLDDLRKEGFSERVVAGVGIMTHNHEVPYDDYIHLIATNKDARLVKLADLEHNSIIFRMKGLRKKDFDRLEKYHRAYAYLSE